MDRLKNISYRPCFLLFALLIVQGINVCFAQDGITELDEIEIIASPIEKFGVGAAISNLDSSLLINYRHSSLASLLSSQSSIYVKQYGAGMLSSVSFRGTGAGHTAIRWNGMLVGYPFLGQADLSLFPLDFTDKIQLIHGSSSARYGTGAIGGTIDLQSIKPQHGIGITANQSFGSFGTSNSALQISNGWESGYIKIGGIHNQSKNDFTYRSRSGETLGIQENAEYLIDGYQLESKFDFNSANSILLNVQGVFTNRNLQASIGSNVNNTQLDDNFWSSLIYNRKLKFGNFEAQYGYLFDRINYNGSVTHSEQNKAGVRLEYDVNNSVSTEVGVNSNWVMVATSNYENNVASENQTNIYASIAWRVLHRLKTSLNIRQAIVTGFQVPFTPSLGLEYNLIKSAGWLLEINSQLAKGYKVPTLNDRFWVPGGNQELVPEESISAEVGFSVKNNNMAPIWLSATTYKLWVDNWILWLPQGSIWSPENKRKVNGFGVELESGFEKSMGQAKFKGWVNYAFTKSTNQVALDEYDRSVGKQLPYVPVHNGNITAQLSINGWEFQLNAVATGKRFITSDNENEVPGYGLLNVRGAYAINLTNWRLVAHMEGNNITNTNYQSIINRAMPGINFLAGVKINYNK